MIVLEATDERQAEMWKAVLELGDRQPRGWTLIGAQMVALHALEHGIVPPRASLDADILINVRILQDGTQRFARLLTESGFELDDVNIEGIGHRYRRGVVRVDILAPDGLGRRTNVRTTGPARTVQVPGGSQALGRTEVVRVQLGDVSGAIPRPSLLGAVLLKSRAIEVDDTPEAQLTDLIFLLSLVQDPRSFVGEMSRSERNWLRRRRELHDPDSAVWRGVASAEDAYLAFRVLAGL